MCVCVCVCVCVCERERERRGGGKRSLTFPLKIEGSLASSKYAIFLILASPTPLPSL